MLGSRLRCRPFPVHFLPVQATGSCHFLATGQTQLACRCCYRRRDILVLADCFRTRPPPRNLAEKKTKKNNLSDKDLTRRKYQERTVAPGSVATPQCFLSPVAAVPCGVARLLCLQLRGNSIWPLRDMPTTRFAGPGSQEKKIKQKEGRTRKSGKMKPRRKGRVG